MKKIPVFKPAYDNQEIKEMKKTLLSGWIGLGPKTEQFEQEFAKFIGVKYALGTSSCTTALDLALRVLDVSGKEVITPSLTFVSANHVILYNGAKPVFADVEEDTLCIDPADIEKKITKKTAAIIVMHYGGHTCRMDEIMRISRKYKIPVIEDVAHGCGGEYQGRKLGSFGDLACFSFAAVKNLATGDGGMVVTNNQKYAERIKKLRWFGIDKSTYQRAIKSADKHYHWQYQLEELGHKYHMFDIQATLGLVQLKKLPKLNEKRRRIVKIYNQALKNISWLEPPVEKSYAKSAWHLYIIKVSAEHRNKIIDWLAKNGIDSSVHYYPNHLYPLYKKYRTSLPITEKVWQKIITLPLFPTMTKQEINRVIEAIKSYPIPKPRILVTGSAGFIGKALVKRLRQEKYPVREFDIKNSPSQDVLKIKKISEDIVIHLAAIPGIRASIENPEKYLKTNILGTFKVLQAAKNAKKIIFSSSSSIYGGPPLPNQEDASVHPYSPYAVSKVSAEYLCYCWHVLYKIPITIVRLFTVFGPWQRQDMAIYKFIKAKFRHQKAQVYGNSWKDYTYIDDIVDGIIRALKHEDDFAIYNLGSGKRTHLSKIVKAIAVDHAKLPVKLGDVQESLADVTKATKILGYQPKISINEGIKKEIEWFKKEILKKGRLGHLVSQKARRAHRKSSSKL